MYCVSMPGMDSIKSKPGSNAHYIGAKRDWRIVMAESGKSMVNWSHVRHTGHWTLDTGQAAKFLRARERFKLLTNELETSLHTDGQSRNEREEALEIEVVCECAALLLALPSCPPFPVSNR